MGDPAWPIRCSAIFKRLTGPERVSSVVVERDASVAVLAVDKVGLAGDDDHEASQIKLLSLDEARIL